MSESDPKERLVNYLYEPIAAAIRQWQPHPRADIYGIWLDLSLTEDNPCLPVVSFVAHLSKNHTTDELIESYGSAFSTGCWTSEILLNLCEDSGHWFGDPDYLGDPEGRALRDEYFASIGVPPSKDSHVGCMEAFLSVCSEVIRRLHQAGVIEAVCGKPVPFGMAFSNDVGNAICLAPTRDANPSGLSREMEEWMMGMTYAQQEAREAFFAEIDAKPLEEQAEFWIDASIAEDRKSWGKQNSALAARLDALQIIGMRDIEPQFRKPLGLFAVPRLIEELERYATVRIIMLQEPGYTEKWVASSMSRPLLQVGRVEENRAAIPQEAVSRLHLLLTRLFHKGESLEKIDIVTSHIAGILHVFRPEQYPAPITGPGGKVANRLLNWRDFGLERSNPHTPEYHPNRALLEEAYSTFQNSLKQTVLKEDNP